MKRITELKLPEYKLPHIRPDPVVHVEAKKEQTLEDGGDATASNSKDQQQNEKKTVDAQQKDIVEEQDEDDDGFGVPYRFNLLDYRPGKI